MDIVHINMNKIIITGNCPSKKNSKIISCRGVRPLLFPSSKYTDWHKDASRQLIGQKQINSTKLTVTFFAGDNRKFDLSNKFESIADLLVDNGLLKDDNWEYLNDVHLLFGGIDKDNPRAIIEY